MKIILLQNIKGIGKKLDVKEVKDGYARNFLIARKLAKIATKESIKELETQKAILEKKEREIKNELEILVKDLADKEFQFMVKTGGKDEVFGSVGKDDIKTRIIANIKTNRREYLKDIRINLERPIKTLGEHQVEIDLGKGMKTKVKLQVLAQV